MHGFNFIYTSHISSPTPYPSVFCLVFSSILITVFELKLYCIFSPCSWHVSKLRPNIFILTQFDQHQIPVPPRVYKSSFHHVVPSNVNGLGLNFHNVYACHPQQHLILYTSHQVINCVPKNFISSVLLQNPTTQSSIQHIDPNVFNSFHRNVIDGESYGVFASPSSANSVSLNFTIEPLPSVTYPFFLDKNAQNN